MEIRQNSLELHSFQNLSADDLQLFLNYLITGIEIVILICIRNEFSSYPVGGILNGNLLIASEIALPDGEYLIGNHPKIVEIFDLLQHLSHTDANVLIRGESGSGKGLIAKAIHYFSSRQHSPFVKVSYAVLSEGVLESELFGHERGAFTGAYVRRKGRFEIADGGTIFLDEVGEISPNIQVKLLRVLQDREFERVGGNRTLKVDVRFIAATHRDLREEATQGRFREDLFYRLNVISISIPPLRERVSDIPELVQYFITRGARPHQDAKAISSAALKALMSYSWPGNVRELENVIMRATALAPGDAIDIIHLPREITQIQSTTPLPQNDFFPFLTLREARRQFERQFIEAALRRNAVNVSRTAREIHIARRNLQEKIRQLGIDTDRLRREISRAMK
jgi:DNA-binding NtrC family response regulator